MEIKNISISVIYKKKILFIEIYKKYINIYKKYIKIT